MYSCKRILIVDDEPQVVFVLRHSLRKLGNAYEILTATNGQEALDKIKVTSFNLLITDLAMPGMNGVALTENARTIDPNLKIVWLTAYDHWKAEAERLGVYRYMLKPVDIDLVRQIVQEEMEANGTAPTPPSSSEKNILILDDNDHIRRLFSRALEQSGYKTYPIATLQEARDLLAQRRFDVFLCDIHVGADRGTDLLREQSGRLNQAGTHVIMVSADPRYRSLCAEMGIEFYMEKPVAIAPLITLVNRLTSPPAPAA